MPSLRIRREMDVMGHDSIMDEPRRGMGEADAEAQIATTHGYLGLLCSSTACLVSPVAMIPQKGAINSLCWIVNLLAANCCRPNA
jgi:hypothetical protein